MSRISETPNQGTIKQSSKAFLANRRDLGRQQELKQQQQTHNIKVSRHYASYQSIATRLSHMFSINLNDYPGLKKLVENGSFTPDNADLFSLEEDLQLFEELNRAIYECGCKYQAAELRAKKGMGIVPSSERTYHNVASLQALPLFDDNCFEPVPITTQDPTPMQHHDAAEGAQMAQQPEKHPEPQSKPKTKSQSLSRSHGCSNRNAQTEHGVEQDPDAGKLDADDQNAASQSACLNLLREPHYVNNGHKLVNELMQKTSGSSTTGDLGMIEELCAQSTEPQVELSPKQARQADKTSSRPAQAKNDKPQFTLGGVDLGYRQFFSLMNSGRLSLVTLTPDGRENLPKKKFYDPEKEAYFSLTHIKKAGVKFVWTNTGRDAHLNVLVTYRAERKYENHDQDEAVIRSSSFWPLCGEHEIDIFTAKDPRIVAEKLLPIIQGIVCGKNGKRTPEMIGNAIYSVLTNTKEYGVKLNLSKEPRLVTAPDGSEVINPHYLFSLGVYAGFNPSFNKISLSAQADAQNLLFRSTSLAQYGTYSIINDGFYVGFDKLNMPISYYEWNAHMIGVARAYWTPCILKILDCLLNNGACLCFDETPLKAKRRLAVALEEMQQQEVQNPLKQGYIWAVISNQTAEFQGCFAMFEQSRSSSVFVKILENKAQLNELKFLSDHYSGYNAGCNQLDELYGTDIVHGLCMAHARRSLRDALELMPGMLELYKHLSKPTEPSQEVADYKTFFSNLDLFNKDPDKLELPAPINLKKLTEVEQIALSWFFCCNMLFAIEGEVCEQFQDRKAPEFKAALLKARHEKSVPVMAGIWHCLQLLVHKHQCVEVKESADGYAMCKSRGEIPLSKAIVYWLNGWSKLCCFLDDPEIELSNNVTERMLRLPTRAKHNSMFFNGYDGAQAFTASYALIHNCRMLGLNVEQYAVWLICNIQRRLYLDRLQLCKQMRDLASANKADEPGRYMSQPHLRKVMVKDANGQEQEHTFDIFDLDYNQTIYDWVDLTGLLPQDYKVLLDSMGSQTDKFIEEVLATEPNQSEDGDSSAPAMAAQVELEGQLKAAHEEQAVPIQETSSAKEPTKAHQENESESLVLAKSKKIGELNQGHPKDHCQTTLAKSYVLPPKAQMADKSPPGVTGRQYASTKKLLAS